MQLDRKSMRKLKRDATLSICVASAMPHRASRVATISCFTASSWQIWAKFSWLMRLRKRCWSGCSTCSAETELWGYAVFYLLLCVLISNNARSSKYFSIIINFLLTSAQYCCLVSESIWANPPRTRAFIRVRWTVLDSICKGGLRLANCLAKFHQFSHCTTIFALNRQRKVEKHKWTISEEYI